MAAVGNGVEGGVIAFIDEQHNGIIAALYSAAGQAVSHGSACCKSGVIPGQNMIVYSPLGNFGTRIIQGEAAQANHAFIGLIFLKEVSQQLLGFRGDYNVAAANKGAGEVAFHESFLGRIGKQAIFVSQENGSFQLVGDGCKRKGVGVRQNTLSNNAIAAP